MYLYIYIYIHLFITNVYSCGSIMLQHFIETQSFPEVMELSTGPVFLPAHPFNDRPCATSYVDHARNKPKNCFVSLCMHLDPPSTFKHWVLPTIFSIGEFKICMFCI